MPIGLAMTAFCIAPAVPAESWTLSAAVQRGIAEQAQVAAAKDRAEGSRDLADAAATNRLPQLSLRLGSIWTESRQGRPLFVAANGRREAIGQLVITAPVFDAQLQALAKAARASATAARYQVLLTQLQTAASVTNVWYQLALAQEQVAFWQQTVAYDQTLVARSAKAFRAGAAARIDVVQTQLLLTQARAQLDQAEVQQQTAARELNLQLGLSAEEAAATVANQPIPAAGAFGSFAQLWQQMQARQPLLQLAQKQIGVARAAKAVQKAAYLPVVNAQLAYGIDANGVPSGHDLGWQAGLGLTMPLYSFGQRQDRVAAANANVQALRADRTALLLQMHSRLNQDWGAYRAAQENAQHTKKIAREANAVYRMTQEGFRAGALNALNLAQAQNAWNQARLTALQARLRVSLARQQLLLDTGKLP
ncbi:TolC family protein [Acidithiobacillus sp. CV18-2]|nr:TolC family protein [Igneacidithiobacillus copahuensis]MBU2753173.1 TolC family protein [Acidithiobacillus sp. CV18-3]MBU2757712.1 TolC family protein [Acidithiobacillus sp. BN09-2]MBU2778324.1 TolC family protein [Acidithiobacillus sp. CV18-2]MBU2795810.1 TolC family protein [Acidithiobacillus sp. VAN18-2]MBU2799968.1 TolC family protein [Acidithiobacillus sp. VAN18-4]UTV80188.1 TolC family protein [Acidithiobacillus sp. YTS05]